AHPRELRIAVLVPLRGQEQRVRAATGLVLVVQDLDAVEQAEVGQALATGLASLRVRRAHARAARDELGDHLDAGCFTNVIRLRLEGQTPNGDQLVAQAA